MTEVDHVSWQWKLLHHVGDVDVEVGDVDVDVDVGDVDVDVDVGDVDVDVEVGDVDVHVGDDVDVGDVDLDVGDDIEDVGENRFSDDRDLHVGECDHVDHVLLATDTFSIDHDVDDDDDEDDFVFVGDIEDVGDVHCIDAVYGEFVTLWSVSGYRASN